MVNFDNYARKVGKRGDRDWYEWKVFVSDDDSTMNSIDHVEYLLHPTFPNPRTVKIDRISKFALCGSGWGQFNIIVTVHFTNGKQEESSYFLSFEKEWPES